MRRLLGKIKILVEGERRDFLLRAMPKNSIVAEIGAYNGEFSKKILDMVKPKKLHLIDPWKFEHEEIYKESFYGGDKGLDQKNMDEIFNGILNKFVNEIDNGQVVIHRLPSEEAYKDFEDNYFDWVYIDGNHLYEFVKNDLHLFYPKVKVGGFLTGDDYTEGGWWKGGVKQAVDEFVKEGSVKLVRIKNQQFILKKLSGI